MPLTDTWAQQVHKIIYQTGMINPLAMQLVAHLRHQHRPSKVIPSQHPSLATAQE